VLTCAPDPAEQDIARAILARVARPVVDLSGQLSLKELGALLRRARLFIGVDSAPMHIAAAVGTPTVALFGPSGEAEWGPWMVRSRILTSDHRCRPCGFDGCGGGKRSECLEVIPPMRALAAAEELLEADP
jgi:heptosyltransferase-3